MSADSLPKSANPPSDAKRAERFDALAMRHKDAIYRQLVRMCGNKDDAEDVLVESLVKAYRALPDLEGEGAFRAWLSQIAKRTCWRLRKREAVLQVMGSDVIEADWLQVPDEGPSPEQIARGSELRSCLMKALAALPEIYREVYELRDVEEQPAEFVARRLGLTIPAVKSRLHRARRMLRQTMDDELQCV
jgi:RNA polymerase sigma-70 factor (ECF subfamily)